MSQPGSSPYKKLKTRNNTYVGYVNIIQLDPHKPYKIYDLKETSHEQYGEGLLGFIEGKNKQKWRTQLPSKYLQQLDPEDIKVFKNDIAANRNPFLIFREKMPDKSYRIDIMETSSALLENHKKWEDVPELPPSLDNSLEKSGENVEVASVTSATK